MKVANTLRSFLEQAQKLGPIEDSTEFIISFIQNVIDKHGGLNERILEVEVEKELINLENNLKAS